MQNKTSASTKRVLWVVLVIGLLVLIVVLNRFATPSQTDDIRTPIDTSIPTPTDSTIGYTDNVEVLYQYPELPTGCESVALTIVLQSMGYNLDKTTIVDSHLPYSDWDFVNAFVGSPYSYNGVGAYAPAMAEAANSYLRSQESEAYAYDLSGSSWNSLLTYVEKGYPVMIWTTINLSEPVFTSDEVDGWYWYENEHCVVLYDYDNESGLVSISDPIAGFAQYDKDEFSSHYMACGGIAVAII